MVNWLLTLGGSLACKHALELRNFLLPSQADTQFAVRSRALLVRVGLDLGDFTLTAGLAVPSGAYGGPVGIPHKEHVLGRAQADGQTCFFKPAHSTFPPISRCWHLR